MLSRYILGIILSKCNYTLFFEHKYLENGSINALHYRNIGVMLNNLNDIRGIATA